jgi:hypothetical protein
LSVPTVSLPAVFVARESLAHASADAEGEVLGATDADAGAEADGAAEDGAADGLAAPPPEHAAASRAAAAMRGMRVVRLSGVLHG